MCYAQTGWRRRLFGCSSLQDVLLTRKQLLTLLQSNIKDFREMMHVKGSHFGKM
jgi:hypothetical protein